MTARKPPAGPIASVRGRLVAFAVIVVLVVAGAIGYLVREHAAQQREIRDAPAVATVDLATVATKPRIVFRCNSRAHYGVLAVVSLANPSGPRALTSTKCTRLYSAGQDVLCLSLDRLAVLYKAQILGADLHTARDLPLAGIPSRARLSEDGTLAATTTFTSADSYSAANFSTRTLISNATGAKSSVNLEDFTLVHKGKEITPVDRNFWGVTFAADDNRFYATVSFSGDSWLVQGDLAARTVATMREDAECPSLSPDGTRVVYKKQLGMARGQWRLVAMDLVAGTETKLAETRSVDDQVEWLDDNHVIYGVPGSGGDSLIDDVYSVPADGTGKPKILIAQASSPAVVR